MIEIRQNDEIVNSVIFPVTKPGFESTAKLSLKNTSNENIEIVQVKLAKQDPDVEVVSFPKNLKPEEVGEMLIKFTPTKERTDSLQTQLDFDLVKG